MPSGANAGSIEHLWTTPPPRRCSMTCFTANAMRGKARPPAHVVQVFEQLVNEALDRSAIWLQDWCWSDLLGMLGWDHQAVRVTLQQLQKIAAALAPRVIYCASIRVWRFCEPSKN